MLLDEKLNISDKKGRKIICGFSGQDAVISSAAAEKEKIKMACPVDFISYLY